MKRITKSRLRLGFVLLLGFLTASLFVPIQAAAQFSQLVVFGDSLSDTGRLYAATGGTVPPSPPYGDGFVGRFTNGRGWADYVAEALGLGLSTSFALGGTNFAIGGALTDRTNEFTGDPRCVVDPAVCSQGLLDQINTFLGTVGGAADPDALYIVWAGGNDFRAAPSSATIPSAVTNLVTAVGILAASGARTIVVPTQPPLGKIPEVLAIGNPVVSARLTALTAAFDGALTAALNANGLKVIRVDIFQLLWEITGNPSRFGFSNATDPCLDPLTLTVCANPDQFVFWDLIHPTTAAHAIIADSILQAVK